jgi:hypothetical protein
MKFLLQVRFNGAGHVIGELPGGEQQKVTAEFEAIRQSPGVLDGNQLQAAGTAATVRMDGGKAPPSRREPSSTGTTSTTRQTSMRRSRSRHGSRSPGSAGPLRSARCWSASNGRVPVTVRLSVARPSSCR